MEKYVIFFFCFCKEMSLKEAEDQLCRKDNCKIPSEYKKYL